MKKNNPSVKPATSHQPPTTKLTWLPQKTFELEFTIPWIKVKKTYDEILKRAAAETTLKGFRKGMVPLNIVEKNLDKQKLYQNVLEKLLPLVYDEAVKKHHLIPIISPKISQLSLKENEDWQFKATACESPEIKLGNFEQTIKGDLAKSAIWTPQKGKPDKKDAKLTYDEKLKIVTTALLKTSQVEVPGLLIDDEVNRMLTRLLDQVNALGMTIEQYLASKELSLAQLKAQYANQAVNTLKLEFILQKLVLDRHIKVTKEEVEKMIKAAPDKKIQEKLNTPLQRAYLGAILAKRKALDYLTAL